MGSKVGRAFVVIYAELPGIGEHEEHDKDPRSKAYLERLERRNRSASLASAAASCS
jgi:hypothetical protein